jgi:hypothetical protein
VLVGLPWEQHVAFLDDRGARALDRGARPGGRPRVRRPPGAAGLRDRQRDPRADRPLARPAADGALPAPLHEATKDEDPGSLATYVNFPSTEYLDLSFADFLSFNVYLESQDRLARTWRASRTSPATARS